MDKEKLIELLCLNAYQVWTASLSATGSQNGREQYEFCKKVAPGDLVVEISTIWRRSLDCGRIGRLVKIEQRPRWTRAEMDMQGCEPDEEIPIETYYEVERLTDGGVVEWTNCTFIRVTETIVSWQEKNYPEERIYGEAR
jgi:hypothetical protein